MASTASGVPRTSKNGWGARNRMRKPDGARLRGQTSCAITGSAGPAVEGSCDALGQEPLRVDGGHAAAAGGGDRLAVAVVGHVARGEDAGHARGGGAVAGEQVAVLVHLELAA